MSDNVNIIDIARLAGVSVSTVSRVLNNHPDVSEKTKLAVKQVIEAYSYIPNNNARNLKRESMRAIGVVVKGFTNPFFTQMLNVIQSDLDAQRYTMLLHQVDQNQDEIEAALSLVKEKKPRGLIFMGGSFKQRRDKLAMLRTPFVMATITITRDVDRSTFSSVTIDDYAEAYKVTEKICKGGHTQAAAIGYFHDDKSISRLRIEGFREALRANGCDYSDKNIAYAGDFTMQAGYLAAQRLLAQTKFTCLFCISDLLALGAIRAIYDAGYKIPQDISVVGFDGIAEGSYIIPSLATVKQPDKEMAHESVRILMAVLQGKASHEHKIFTANFHEGESFRNL